MTAPVPADQEEALRERYTVVYEGDPDGMKILSGEPAPGRAVTVIVGDQWEEVATLRAKVEQLASELREAREERDRLREALKPFAKAGELFGPPLRDGFDEGIYLPAAGPEYAIGGSDLRRAKAALTPDPRPSPAKGDGMLSALRGLTPEPKA
jgi:hypothetical protein